MRGLRGQIVMSLVLLLAFGGIAEAQAFGRVQVVVSGADGKPLQGVKVVVTCDEMSKFREETETNKKGKATVSFTDATKVYNFHFEYEDHQPADLQIKPTIRETMIREITLTEGQVVQTDDAGRVRYTPAESAYNEGVVALQANDMATAKDGFMRALEKDKKMAPAHAALALLYASEGSYQKAVEFAEKHLALDPGNPRSLRVRWDAYRELGDEEKAKAAFKELAAADPTVLIVEFYNDGNKLFDAGNVKGAIEKFEHILEIDPEHARAHYRLGVCKVSSDSASAKEHLQKFIELAPDDPEVATAKDMLSFLN